MDQGTWTAVDDYLAPLTGEDDALRAANATAAAAGLPAIAVSTTQGALLSLLARIHGARRVLEVGTLAGYSTIWLARALTGQDRHVTTLEIDPRHAEVARTNVDRAGVGDVVDIRVGRGVDTLAQLTAELTAGRLEPYDLVFIDADKPSNVAYLEAALRLTRPGAVIVVDNVVRGGAVADPESTDERVQASRAVLERAGGDPSLTVTAIQTVGAKGYDGFLLIRVSG